MKKILLFIVLLMGVANMLHAADVTFDISTWSKSQLTEKKGSVTLTFGGASTRSGSYVKVSPTTGTITLRSTDVIPAITITYETGYGVQASRVGSVTANTGNFSPRAGTTISIWRGNAKSVVITNGAGGRDLRVTKVRVSYPETYKVRRDAYFNPSGVVEEPYSANNPTSVRVTYGTDFGYNSKDDQVNTLHNTHFNNLGFDWNTNSQIKTNAEPIEADKAANAIPRTGPFYVFEPTEDGEMTVYVDHIHETRFYVVENGNVLIRNDSKELENNVRKTFTFLVKPGSKYYMYVSDVKGWTLPFYGFDFIATDPNTTYTVAEGEQVYSHKHVRTVDGMLMTYGGWLTESDARQSDYIKRNNADEEWTVGTQQGITPYDGFAYVATCAADPTNETGKIYAGAGADAYYKLPSRGAYYKFESPRKGRINVYVLQNEGKTLYFVDENGDPQAAISHEGQQGTITASGNSYTASAKGAYHYTFDVYPGKTYFLFTPGSKLGLYGFTYGMGQQQPTEVVLDGSADNYTPTAAPLANVTLKSTFVRNRWNALTLPFSMTQAQVRDAFGEGTVIMQFDDVANNTIHFKQHYYQHYVAGQPVIIRPTFGYDAPADSSNHDNVSQVVVKGVHIDAATQLKEYKSRSVKGFTFKAMYNRQVPAGGFFVSNNQVYHSTNGTNWRIFRSVLVPETVQAKAMSLRMSMARWIGPMTTDGIEMMTPTGTPANGNVYTLQGVLVRKGSTNTEGLPAGIYVMNGKKFIVK